MALSADDNPRRKHLNYNEPKGVSGTSVRVSMGGKRETAYDILCSWSLAIANKMSKSSRCVSGQIKILCFSDSVTQKASQVIICTNNNK